jgi:hypothetical protein
VTKIYLSGPMTGLPDYNYPAFNKAALELREMDHEVFNPAEAFSGDQSLDWRDYMRADVAAIMGCDEVRVLPGWESSVGARLEVAIAISIGLPVKPLHVNANNQPVGEPRDIVKRLLGINEAGDSAESILDEAARLVGGDRQSDYGHPFHDFSRTALIWTGLFLDKLKPGEQFTARDVPLAMNGIKMSREANKPKRDNRVDGAGYWQTLDMVDSYEQDLC